MDVNLTRARRRALADLLRPHRLRLLAIAGLSIVGALLMLRAAFALRALAAGYGHPDALNAAFAACAVLIVAYGATFGLAYSASYHLARKINATLANAVFVRVLRKPLAERTAASVDADKAVTVSSLQEVAALFRQHSLFLFADATVVIGGLLALASLNAKLTAVLSPGLVLIAAAAALLGLPIRRANLAALKVERRRTALIFEVLDARRLRAIQRSARLLDEFEQHFRGETRQHDEIVGRRGAPETLFNQGTRALAMAAAPISWWIGSQFGVGLQDVVVFVVLMPFVVRSLAMSAEFCVAFLNCMPHLQATLDVLAQPPYRERGVDRTLRDRDLRGEPLTADCLCVDLGGKRILHDVQVTFPAGSWTAVVGPTGGGKTTLGDALTMLVPPAAGELCIGEVPYSAIPLSVLERYVGAVDTDPTIFSGSVRENLVRLRPDARGAAVETAMWLAAIDFSLDGPAAALSAGQKVRLLLARQLLAQPSVLILDEALMHLDAETRSRVVANLRDTGITVVEVTHDPSAAARADRVVVVAEGIVAATGTYAELAADAAYRPLLGLA